MLKKRDAQGMSIRVIIIAVIAILILFALVVMFDRQKDRTETTLASCFAKGGGCVDKGKCIDGEELTEVKCEPEIDYGNDEEYNNPITIEKVCCVTLDR